MKFPVTKTKIVCTLGPASQSKKVIKKLFLAGMNIARLNLAHDTLDYHRKTLHYIHEAEKELGVTIPVLMDIPGPKIRIGRIENGPITLRKGQLLKLTTKKIAGNERIIPVEYEGLVQSVKKGSLIYLYDGFIQLRVLTIIEDENEIICRVLIGGKIDSYKGLNLPKARITLEPIREQDLELLSFGLEEGVNIFGISFVEKAEDIIKVKEFARRKGKNIYTVAKIEREEAVQNIQEILSVTDAIMVARGDLGVQVSIDKIPVLQKNLIAQANKMSRPVITATQMLVSMTDNIRPTRSEVTDVANAILDGTDATMLSEETAVGKYPVEATRMMSNIAVSTEKQYRSFGSRSSLCDDLQASFRKEKPSVEDVISLHTLESSQTFRAKYVLTPTESGNTPRRISRLKPFCWILAFTNKTEVARFLTFSYGVIPFLTPRAEFERHQDTIMFLKKHGLVKKGDYIVITEGSVRKKVGGTDSLRIIQVE
ncbi:MAG: pyruvate kinase [Candidatus Atribacteria bacterium]|nr:pyruvate kinase [Candidatus Atribacteria bacterium]